MFASYEAEFDAILDAVQTSLGSVESVEDAGERRTALSKCELDVGQAESLVRQMNVEARSDPGAGLKKRLTQHKERIKTVRQGLSAVQQASERRDLFASREGGGDGGYVNFSQEAREDRSRFEQVTARMDRSSEALLDSRRVIAETEDVAMGISEQLESNRSLIIGAHERVTATSGLMGGASQILRRMRQRETRRKVMLGGIIALLAIVIIFILYVALRPAASASDPSSS